ncbi:hypothetical protein [Streptomyces sp. NRRL S-337]|uniref:hypothetical protein n=1 Tax=Streptomyces sp. NRRL S-337 TaxID=1463900 RepID=UPI0004C5BBFD|nr:hypothetical protein [Streptomyces sp. NRRL S-337]
MNRIKLAVAGVAVAVCATAVTTTSAFADSSAKSETTAVAFQEASTKPEKIAGGDGRVEPRCGWAGFAKGIAQGVVGNAVYEGLKYAANHPVKAQEKMFRRGGIPAPSEVGAAGMSRAFD